MVSWWGPKRGMAGSEHEPEVVLTEATRNARWRESMWGEASTIVSVITCRHASFCEPVFGAKYGPCGALACG